MKIKCYIESRAEWEILESLLMSCNMQPVFFAEPAIAAKGVWVCTRPRPDHRFRAFYDTSVVDTSDEYYTIEFVDFWAAIQRGATT